MQVPRMEHENKMETPHLFWCNLSTNGISSALSWSRILEIAVILTDFDLNRIASYEAVLFYDRARQTYSPLVDKAYMQNGLWGACARSQLTISQAQTHLLAFTLTHCNEEKPILAGRSLSNLVVPFFRAHLSTLSTALCHRTFDVEALRMAMEDWGGVEGSSEVQAPRATVSLHTPVENAQDRARRAMDNLRETVESAQRFREALQS